MHINVPVSDQEKKRIEAEEETWTPLRMVGFGVVFLGFCLVALYCMANFWDWMHWSTR